jgi:hypothetical protein
MKQIILLFFGIISWTASISQAQSFATEVSKDTVLLGNYIEIKYVLINIDGKFDQPDFGDMQLVGGPNHSSSMSSINGDVRKQSAYSYYVEPLEEGEFFIEPVFIETDERTWESEPIKIVVLPNPEGIIENPSMSNSFNFDFEFGDFFDNNPFFKEDVQKEDPKKKPKVKVRKI